MLNCVAFFPMGLCASRLIADLDFHGDQNNLIHIVILGLKLPLAATIMQPDVFDAASTRAHHLAGNIEQWNGTQAIDVLAGKRTGRVRISIAAQVQGWFFGAPPHNARG
jgi:hypothetical protein